MTRKTYYLILSIFLLIFVSGLLFNMYVTKIFAIRMIVARFEDLLVLFILLIETIRAAKVIRIVNTVLLSLLPVGIMFRIMHWPFGLQLIWFPFVLIILLLLINNLKNWSDQKITYLILLIPVLYIMDIFVFRNIRFGEFAVWIYPSIKIVELIINLGVAIILGVQVKRQKIAA